MHKSEKQGKVKGRGTVFREKHVCTRDWRGTRLEATDAGFGTPRGTERGTPAPCATTACAAVVSVFPESRS